MRLREFEVADALDRIAVLMTCHNRREMTLRCLGLLTTQLRSSDKVFLVDDGSVDGTADAIAKCFDMVHTVRCDGSLFWARGMRKAWETSVSERQDWGAYLWLNDDTELRDDAIAKLLAVNNGERIVVGDLEDSNGEIVYGLRHGGVFTGNCVLVPRKVYEKLGMICGGYSHAWADSDYAIKAKRAGIDVVSAGIVGRAESHPNRPRLKGLSLLQRLRLLHDPKGWNVHDLWLYRRRNFGLVVAVFSCLHLVVHVVMGER